MKSKIGDLVIQIISVTIGVFLGFAISNWSESSRERDKYQSLINNIRAEIRENKSKIEQVIDYHKVIRDSSRAYVRLPVDDSYRPTFFRGINTVIMVNSAYQTGIQTGLLANMNLDQIQAINDIYSKQNAYEDFTNLLLSGLITMDFEENAKSMRKIARYLAVSMTDVVIKEQQLLQSYEEALVLLE
ncbi:MAG: hypothetical protein WBA74_09010 [Cyclobacteriaceae bacterium]